MNFKFLLATILLLSLCLIPAQVAAENKKIYVWRDANGVLVFSDSPQPKANVEEIKLNDSKSITMAVEDTKILNQPTKKNTDQIQYKISIINPTQDETIRDNTGSIHISGRVIPRFEPGHKVQLYLDDIKQGTPQPSILFVLRNVDRGEHNIQLKLLNAKNKVIASSEKTRLFMHRRSIITGP